MLDSGAMYILNMLKEVNLLSLNGALYTSQAVFSSVVSS